MKICTVCQRCYEDFAAHCEENHGSLATERAGTRQMTANYRLDFLLERDAAGDKYLATHIVLNQPFVTRIISRSVIDGAGEMAREAFLGEAQAAANIFHPNLIRVCESGSLESGDLYTVTELVSGRTLSEYLRDTGSLPPADEAVIITRQAAEALEAAHNAGVIHRAINPANIILIRDEQQNLSVKLQNFDFGGLEQQTIADNKSGAVQSQIDAARYFSPEQRAGETVDARTDIYSLAFVLYEMLCGRPPFDSPTSQQINEQPLERLHFDIKALLTHVLKNSLQQRPEARTPKSANFVRLLRHIEQIIARLSGSFTKAAQPSLPKTTALGAASDSDYASLPPEIKQAASEPLPPFLINTPVLSDTTAPAPLDSEIWLPITPVTAQPPKLVEEIKENTADSKDVFSPNSEWIPVREKESMVEQSVFSSEPEWIPVKETVSDVEPSLIEPVLFMDSESDAAPTVPPFQSELFLSRKNNLRPLRSNPNKTALKE